VTALKPDCSVDGCDTQSRTTGLCGRHYQRMRNHGSPAAPGIEERQAGGECAIGACARRSHAMGLCVAHYLRQSKYGDPLFTKGYDIDHTAPRYCLTCKCDIAHMRSNAAYCGRPCKLTAADRRRNARPSSILRQEARRARKFGNPGYVEVTAREWERIRNRTDGRCAYCHERPEQLHMDHVVPLARMGRHAPANIAPACPTCNGHKSDLFLSEWKRRPTYPRG